jgi:hypothetical protein
VPAILTPGNNRETNEHEALAHFRGESYQMKIEILHNVFGSITVDQEGKISVGKPDLAERLAWLLDHEEDLYGIAHYHTGLNGRLVAVMEYLGIAGGITKVTTEGEQQLPPGAVY